jgi:hypothetical protein
MAKVALLIGVSEYEPGLNPLPAAVKDVEAMRRVLVHPEMGGFAEADITVLKNPQRQAMEDAIYNLFANRQKDDLLLFYFSGHGVKDESGRLYLSTCFTRKENGRLIKPSAVGATVLHENLNESRSQRQVLILDCCFSGAIAQGLTVKDDGSVNVQEHLGGKGRAILTASTSTQYSFEQEAVEFCARLSRETGREYRLPSEAEWEYACRAGTTTPFHFGETISTDLANYCGEDRTINGTLYKGSYGDGSNGIYREQTTEVGSFSANAFGLYDMHGNVWEWCADHWHDSYDGAPTDGSVWLSENENTSRLLRGGSWGYDPFVCRSASRNDYSAEIRYVYNGFRVVCGELRT